MKRLLGPEGGEIPSRSLQDYVAGALARALFEGKLAPGQRIPVSRLADELEVSHIPVREALRAFEAEGHIVSISHRGFFVAELSLEDVEDIYRWRKVLEDEALRKGIPNLSDDNIDFMEDLWKMMNKASRAHDHGTFAEANREFHFVPFHQARSPRLVRFLNQLWDSNSRYHSVLLQAGEKIRLLQAQHRDLLAACRARAVEEAIEIMESHRQVTLARMREGLVKSQAGPQSSTSEPKKRRP